MKATFAKKTRVPVERTQQAIQVLLKKHGAEAFGTYGDSTTAAVAFKMRGLSYRIELPVPKSDEQGFRARWRLVLLLVRAKLELVAVGASTIEREFLADQVMPNGKTVGDSFPKIIQAALGGGDVRRLLSA